MKEILKEKDMKLFNFNLVRMYYAIFQDVILGKDGQQKENQKLLSEIRREYENVKRKVKSCNAIWNNLYITL